MITNYTTGIDIGTHTIKIVITEKISQKDNRAKILYAIESPSHGFRHGYITDIDAASSALSRALKKIESVSKIKIDEAQFSIGGAGLSSKNIRTNITIAEKEEVSNKDIDNLIQKSEELFSQKYPNKKILHIIPVKYLVDGKNILGNPIGMYGNNLESRIIFITIPEHHYDSLLSLISRVNLQISDLVAAPLANAEVAANHKQKSQGCIIANIGSETTSLATFENGVITSLAVHPLGSNDITNDLALGLQTSLDVAENIKILKNKDFPQRKVDEIIYARVSDILDLIEHHLKSIKKNRLLPAGVIYTGGGSKILFLEKYTKEFLHLPAEKTTVSKFSVKTKRNSDIGSQYSVVYGLCSIKTDYGSRAKKLFNLKKIKKFFTQLISHITP